MKKKIVYLIVLVILTTGCSVDYNLVIDGENNFSEDFTVTALQSENQDLDYLMANFKEEYPVFNDQEFQYYDPYVKNDKYTYYEKSYVAISNGYKFNYKVNLNYNNFNRARTIKTVFKTGGVGYVKEEDYYYLSLSNLVLFDYNQDLEFINVNITFKDLEVISNNALEVRGNTYTWRLDKNSKEGINVKYKRKSNTSINPNPSEPIKENDNKNKRNSNSLFNYIVVGTILLLFVIGLVGFIKYKSIRK